MVFFYCDIDSVAMTDMFDVSKGGYPMCVCENEKE